MDNCLNYPGDNAEENVHRSGFIAWTVWSYFTPYGFDSLILLLKIFLPKLYSFHSFRAMLAALETIHLKLWKSCLNSSKKIQKDLSMSAFLDKERRILRPWLWDVPVFIPLDSFDKEKNLRGYRVKTFH